MSLISRRVLLRASMLGLVAGCAPAMWPQTERGGYPRPGLRRGPTADSVSEFMDEISLGRACTVECAEAMPEQLYSFRPVAEERTFGQQMVHIAESVRGIFEVFVQDKAQPTFTLGEAGKEVVKSKAEVVALVRESFTYVHRGAADLTDVDLDMRVQFLDNRPFSKGRVVRFLLDHATYHRGESAVYMRLNGIRPPRYRA
ncbi:MAG TPA: DinB family protein [Terriglobales bacterium]|nr:DinB family protein [Terriglobales bacterium]